MLKLVYTPTSEIKELEPNSQWKREDGAVCTLIVCEMAAINYPWSLILEGRTVESPHKEGRHYFNADEMLTWLRRDFERLGEKVAINDTIKTIPCGRLFRANANDALYMKSSTGRIFRFPSMDETTHPENWHVRDLGPIEIDDSVKGVG